MSLGINSEKIVLYM